MKCFVTVGSTQFEALIYTLVHNDLSEIFSKIGVQYVVIQNGSGKIPKCFQLSPQDDQIWLAEIDGIKFSLFRYKNSIRKEMQNADLVIGHAGAGTCLEVLELGKPFVTVINRALMDDHQLELAEEMAREGHLLCTFPEKLHETLQDPSLFNLIPYPKHDPTIFSEFLNNFMNSNK